MCVGWDCVASLELAHRYKSARLLVLVQNHQLNALVRPGLPHSPLVYRDVWKHRFIETGFRLDCKRSQSLRSSPKTHIGRKLRSGDAHEIRDRIAACQLRVSISASSY